MQPAMLTPFSRSSQQQNQVTGDQVTGKKGKRTKNHVIQIVGNRIYDPKSGKTCHECRQKTMDLAASCKNLKSGRKPCTLHFCHSCLLNRYGEEVAQVEQLSNWSCPKCRNECICSFCRKKQGLPPTGPLVKTAKALGYKCVADMLHSTTNGVVSPVEKATMEKEEMDFNTKSSGDEVIMSDVIPLLWPDLLKDEEFEISLLGKAEEEKSLDGNSCFQLNPLKDQNTSLEVSTAIEREGLREIFNGTGSNVVDASESRRLKRFKTFNECLEEDSKRNANDDINLLHEVPEKGTKVARNNDILDGENDDPHKWDENEVFDAFAYAVDDSYRWGLNFYF